MKKLLLLLLLSGFAFGQNVSPYYPVQQTNASRGLEPSQLTYYDTFYVQSLLPEFLSQNLMMTQLSSDMDVKTKTIKQVYQDKFSYGKLNFFIKTDVIKADVITPEIVKSIKITGTPDRVFSFFVRYWDSTIDFESIKSDVERKHMQDVAKLYFNGGKPYILITNNTYKSTEEFDNYFSSLLQRDNTNLHN